MVTSTLGYLLTLPRFNYSAPSTVEEACSLLSKHKSEAKILAGGTDLLVSMKKRKISPRYLIGIKAIPGLDYIQFDQDGLKIGALATLRSIASSPVVKDKFGLLAAACRKIGTPQVRNMATLAGNVCQAGPSQDGIPPLLVLEARLKLVSTRGQRIIPIDQFFKGPFQSALEDNELLTEIQIPTPPVRSGGCYRWATKITAIDETLVGVAVLIKSDPAGKLCEDVRIGLCSVAPSPIRARQAEELLRGRRVKDELVKQAAQVAAGETSPRSRADYRRCMTLLLVERALHEAWRNIKNFPSGRQLL